MPIQARIPHFFGGNGYIPITISMKSARFMFVIMWLLRFKKMMEKKKYGYKERSMISRLKFYKNYSIYLPYNP